MCNLKKIAALIGMLLAFVDGSAQEAFTSQPVRRNEYALVLYAGGGPGYYLPVAGAPAYLNPEVSKWSPVTSVRLMWFPDHLLKVGVESGYMRFLSYSFKDSVGNKGRILVNAVPLLVEWSMALTKRFNVFAGSGVYFMDSQLDYAGRSSSQKLSIGWMAAVSYIHPLSANLGLGTELKWLDAAETTDGSISLQVQLVWKILKW